VRTAIGAALSLLVWTSALADGAPRDARDLKLLRFELDNDTLVGSDDAFTAGSSIQLHSPPRDEWPPRGRRWASKVPGLGDDGAGERVVRRGVGVTQVIITPQDITIARPQPDDVPWAGMLGGYVSWSSYDNETLAAVQVYLGCLGPCSHAEEVQKLVHNSFGLGDEPAGWHNQLADKLLVNVNYEYRRKLWSRASGKQRGWSHDLSAGAQVGVGSFARYAQGWLEYRFGWDVPQGFTNLADPPALGVALDPHYVDPASPARLRSWRPHFSLVARLRSLGRFAPIEGGRTDDGGFYAGLPVHAPGDEQLALGIHVASTRCRWRFI
jgi:hypothetical protein